MPESLLKLNGENTNQGPTQNHLEVLSEMKDKFDPEKARQLASIDRKKIATNPTHLEAIKPKEKSVDELTPEEASKEYLDLLMDFSSDFTSAEGKSSRPAEYDKNGNLQIGGRGYSGKERRIVGQLYETATGKKFEDEERLKSIDNKWQDEYIDREFSLSMADDIISAESAWRAAGESTTQEAEAAEKAAIEQESASAKAKLEKIERGPFGKLKKAFFVNFRKKEYYKLYNLAHHPRQTQAEEATKEANSRLQKSLEAAYSEDYGYGHHKLSYEHTRHNGSYADKINSEYNDRFFDKAKKAKIDRAIELRRRLQSEGIIKSR